MPHFVVPVLLAVIKSVVCCIYVFYATNIHCSFPFLNFASVSK